MGNDFFDCPETVEIDGIRYAINTSFWVWIEIEQFLKNKNTEDEISAAKILSLAYVKLPHNPTAALEKIFWFYFRGEESRERANDGGFCAPVYDLKSDFQYIWAGFLGDFGIDLFKIDLHWWKFGFLLSSLSDDCRFSRIVSYRVTDTSKIKNKEIKRFYERMKKKYRLSDNRSSAEKETEIAVKLGSLF